MPHVAKDTGPAGTPAGLCPSDVGASRAGAPWPLPPRARCHPSPASPVAPRCDGPQRTTPGWHRAAAPHAGTTSLPDTLLYPARLTCCPAAGTRRLCPLSRSSYRAMVTPRQEGALVPDPPTPGTRVQPCVGFTTPAGDGWQDTLQGPRRVPAAGGNSFSPSTGPSAGETWAARQMPPGWCCGVLGAGAGPAFDASLVPRCQASGLWPGCPPGPGRVHAGAALRAGPGRARPAVTPTLRPIPRLRRPRRCRTGPDRAGLCWSRPCSCVGPGWAGPGQAESERAGPALRRARPGRAAAAARARGAGEGERPGPVPGAAQWRRGRPRPGGQ